MKSLKYALPVAAALCFANHVPAAADAVNNAATVFAAPVAGVEHLSGELSTGHGGKAAKGKGKASQELVLHVHTHHGKKATDPSAKHGKTVKLTASGDVLAKLHALAEKHAHVKVSGTLNGDTMAVTEVTEAAGKGKNKK